MTESGADNPNVTISPEQAELILAQTYEEVFATPGGRAILADLESKFACNPFAEGKPDLTAFRCGGLRILQEIGEQIQRGRHPQPRQESVNGY